MKEKTNIIMRTESYHHLIVAVQTLAWTHLKRTVVVALISLKIMTKNGWSSPSMI